MGIRNKVTGEVYTITTYDQVTGEITGINISNGNTDLGNVNTVYIGGGNPGEVLATDGAGNLSWVPASPGTGDITFVNTTMSAPNDEDIYIEALKDDGTQGSAITLSPGDALMRLEQYSLQDSQSFDTTDWTTGVYTSQGVPPSVGVIEFTDAPTIIALMDSLAQGAGQIFFSVNGGPLMPSDGVAGGGGGITFYVPDMPAVDPTTVTAFEVYYSYYSRIEIDYDDEEFTIQSNNIDLILSTTGNQDIDIESSRNLYLSSEDLLNLTNFSTVDGIDIRTNANAVTNTWSFGADGNLRLPANTFAVNYANGDPVSLANTGNVTFDNVTVQGNNFLNLSVGPDYTANLAYLQLRAGDFPSHIHLDTGDSAVYDLYIGNDQKFVQVSSTGNIIMSSYDNVNSYQMTLDTTGNLTVPGNIQSVTTGFSFTSSISGINTGSPTVIVTLSDAVFGGPDTGQVTITGVVGTTEADGTWYFQSIDPSNFVLYYDAALTLPVDGTTWTTYVSGGIAVALGYNNLSITGGNVDIVTNGGDTWTFDSTGNLTIPGTSGGLIKTVANASIGIAAMDDGTDNPAQLMSWNVGSANPSTIISAYASNATIQSNVTGAINTWEFDNTGNLTLPVGGLLVVSGGIVGGGASPAPYLSGFSSLATVGAQGNITASGFFKGDGGYLSNIAGSNVVGEVALANTISNPAQPNITSVGTLVSLTTGALNTTGQFTADGNTQFNGNVFFTGSVTLPGTINQISGNSGSFFGDPATGFGALYVGIPSGYTTLNNEVAQFSDSFNGYTQITHRNINGGSQATGDIVITADNGTDLVNYIDLGMAGSGYDGTLANNSLGTALYPNDGYLYAQGDVTGGNLVLGSNQTNGVVRIIANGASNIGDVVATFRANGLTVAANVAASHFIGNGSQLTSIAGSSVTGIVASASVASVANSIAGANVSGQVANALVAGTVYTAAQPNITSVGTLVSLVVTGNVTADHFVGNGSSLISITGANVTGTVANAAFATTSGSADSVSGANVSGQVANALVAGTVYTAAQPNITSVGTLTELTVTANVTADYFIGNGSQLTGLGNIVTIDLSGNVSQVLAGDGTWIASTPSYGNANVSTYLASGTDTAGYSTLGNIQIGTSGNTKNASDYASTATQVTLSWFGLEFPQPFNIGDTVLISDIVAPGPVDLNGYWTLTGADGSSITFDTTLNPGSDGFDFPGPTITSNIVSSISVTGNISGANLVSTRVVPRTNSIVTLSFITPTSSLSDQFNVTALATAASIQAPSGTPTDGQKLTIRILDNGTPRALTWNAVYQVIGTTLPTTTVANKFTYVGCIYNEQVSKWDVVSVATQA